jgi:hypothetical protein
MAFNYLQEEDELTPLDEEPRRRLVGPRRPFDPPARALPPRRVIPDAPDAPMAVEREPSPDFLRIIGRPQRASELGTAPPQRDLDAALASEAKLKGERPVEGGSKWWQKLAAAGVGGLAGAVNSGGRTQVDPSGAVDVIHGGPQKRQRLSDWMGKVEGAEAKSEAAKGTLDSWMKGRTQDRQDEMADAQIEHFRGQAERDRAAAEAAGRPKPQIIPPGSTVLGPDGKVIFTAPDRSAGRTTVAPGSTVIGPDGKPIYTAPAKPAEHNTNVQDVLLNPDKHTPDQVRKAQELFDKQHRPPSNGDGGGSFQALVNETGEITGFYNPKTSEYKKPPAEGARKAPLPPAENIRRENIKGTLEDLQRLEALGAKHKDRIGAVYGRLTDAELQTIGNENPEVAEMFRIAGNLTDQLLRQRSGAAISEKEYERLSRLLPNPRQPYSTFLSNLKSYQKEVARQSPKSGGQAAASGDKKADPLGIR